MPANIGKVPADYRFARAVEWVLEKEFAPGGLRLGVTQIASGLGVSRASVYLWINGECEIREKTVARFSECDDWRGTFARRVREIHSDQRRWKVERDTKEFRKWRRALYPY